MIRRRSTPRTASRQECRTAGFTLLEVIVSLAPSLLLALISLQLLAGVANNHRLAVQRSGLSILLWNESEKFRAARLPTSEIWRPMEAGNPLRRAKVSAGNGAFRGQWEVLRARK